MNILKGLNKEQISKESWLHFASLKKKKINEVKKKICPIFKLNPFNVYKNHKLKIFIVLCYKSMFCTKQNRIKKKQKQKKYLL